MSHREHIARWRILAFLTLLGLCAVVAKESYYDILGVAKDADDRAIKKAYREMALKWHPDKNPDNREAAEKRFREVAEAYEVLSNADRRRSYDAGGSGVEGHGGFSGFGGSGFDFGGFGNFKDPKDLFKEMFGNADPFADFSKFFSDVHTFEETVGGSGDDGAALEKLEQALCDFYNEVGQPEKGQLEQVRKVLQMPKWAGREEKMYSNLKKKYTEKVHVEPLQKLRKAFDELSQARRSSGGNSGFGEFGNMDFGGFGGDFGGFGDLFGGGGFKMSGGMGGMGGSSTVMFSSSFSTSSGGKTVKSETRIENGKRVTKTIESDASGTRATMEEQNGNRIKRTSGSRTAEQLGHEEM
eukprot:TRINITY_DN11533_c0_g1_i3.p1 TRINITY_DN11533_c0_g1~~TRINITY_DN11533_c0_g1_i3.p1  ORF type:complete len:355 (+),score=90.53 TRINITY_DN11533_c0_g1_i3:44-1108(+)